MPPRSTCPRPKAGLIGCGRPLALPALVILLAALRWAACAETPKNIAFPAAAEAVDAGSEAGFGAPTDGGAREPGQPAGGSE